MRRVKVAPALVLDGRMYEAARDGIRRHTPRLASAFTWERFTARTSWILVPDTEHPDDPWYKAEMVLERTEPATTKLNVWRRPDLRRDGKPIPHSHPWAFTGHLLLGGYEEDRYAAQYGRRVEVDPFSKLSLGGVTVQKGVTHTAGQNNPIALSTFHEVTKVLEPGRTLSLMDCGFGRKDGWGYLDPDTGLYTPTKQSPVDRRFKALLLDRNPHLRG